MNNPLMMLLQAARTGGNPMQMLRQMAAQNPAAAQAMNIVNGKTPQQLQQIAMNMCRERGTTPEAIARQLGLK